MYPVQRTRANIYGSEELVSEGLYICDHAESAIDCPRDVEECDHSVPHKRESFFCGPLHCGHAGATCKCIPYVETTKPPFMGVKN